LILIPIIISRIINGFEVPPHSIPFQVLMLLNGRFQCGGSLISAQYVLTAAHCVVGQTASSLTIVAGEHNVVNDVILVF
jgi:secreted trypsin-like serine protease